MQKKLTAKLPVTNGSKHFFQNQRSLQGAHELPVTDLHEDNNECRVHTEGLLLSQPWV
jgi:hypothetical protein